MLLIKYFNSDSSQSDCGQTLASGAVLPHKFKAMFKVVQNYESVLQDYHYKKYYIKKGHAAFPLSIAGH
jgi:hypothetical protein